jgi:hypothetical protein
MSGQNPIVSVQIAHICAVEEDGARYDKRMTEDERRSFPNLILLCLYHHSLIDGKSTRRYYSVDLLHEWKTSRESNLPASLDDLTESDLEALLASTVERVITDTKVEVLAAISSVKNISAGTASLLKKLADETFNRPELDLDAVASLADSAQVFEQVADYVPMLHESSRALTVLPDYVPMLSESSRALTVLPDYAPMLISSTRNLEYLPDYSSMLRDATRAIECLPDYLPMLADASSDLSKIPGYLDSMHSLLVQIDRTVGRLADVSMEFTSSRASHSTHLAEVRSTAQDLSDSSALLDSQLERMREAAAMALVASNARIKDRWFYIKRSVTTGAILGMAVIGAAWYLVAHYAHVR